MKLLTFFFFFIGFCHITWSQEESMLAKMLPKNIREKDYVISKSTDTYSILSSTDNSGYVIVSSKNKTEPIIIGYSDNGVWDESIMPPAILIWLDNIKKNKCSETNSSVRSSKEERKSIPALMKSQWHQNSPYNDMCPVIPDGNIKTAAGCVAIAASQVAYYWRNDNPQRTSESTPVYPYGKAPVTYSVPAGTEYMWNLMRDYYTLFESDEEKEAVARLVYIMGTSTYLNYGASTGGNIRDLIGPLDRQFRLHSKYAQKDNFSQEEWEDLIYHNLKASQPVVYAGSFDKNGHAVVVDGYDADLNLFHFNFGWGGPGDGYYTIDDVTGMNGYSSGQECLCDIYPNQRNMDIEFDVIDNFYDSSSLQINITVRNGSSISIDGLYLFAQFAFSYPKNKNDAIWSYDCELVNDNTKISFTTDYPLNYSWKRLFLILTDGEMNVLAQKMVSIQETGVDNVMNDNTQKEEYYSLGGNKLSEKPHFGVYIKKTNAKSILTTAH